MSVSTLSSLASTDVEMPGVFEYALDRVTVRTSRGATKQELRAARDQIACWTDDDTPFPPFGFVSDNPF